MLLLTFLDSVTLLGGAGLNWGLVSAGYRPKLGLAPKMAEALRPLHDDGSGRLGMKILTISFYLEKTAECSRGTKHQSKPSRINQACGFPSLCYFVIGVTLRKLFDLSNKDQRKFALVPSIDSVKRIEQITSNLRTNHFNLKLFNESAGKSREPSHN